jgi:hypothetical protein
MKKSLLHGPIMIVLFLICTSFPLTGQYIVASWSFDALLAATDPVPTASVIGADYGILSASANAYLDGTNGSSTWVSVATNPELTAFGGSTTNDPRPSPYAGMALALANSSANGKCMVFKFSTLGFANITISFATRGTATGFNTHSWEWSTDNITYTSFGTNTAVNTSTFLIKTIDMSAITAVNNTSTVYIKLTVTGATSAAGNNRIDNFVVKAANDVGAPVATFNPANSATDVAVTVTPTITFNEAVLKTDASELTNTDLATLVTFKKTNASGADVPFTATIDAAKKVITVTPSASLDNSQLYYLAIDKVEDASGNETTGSNITFTTIAAATPTVTLTYPVGGETWYAGDPVTFTWTYANVTNVQLEAYIPDHVTRIYAWEVMGSTVPASAGKYDFTIPGDALYGTEYKVRISDASNPAVNSTSGTFTMIALATSITDLRGHCIVNDIVKLSSEVTMTFKRATGNQKYIQDAGSGLLIYDPSAILTTTLAVGDNFTGLEGKIAVYGGLLEIVPTKTTVTVTSSGNTVTPPEMTLTDYNTNYLNYESRLIKLTDVTFPDGNGINTFGSSANTNLTDGSTTIVFRTFATGESDIVGTIIPTDHVKMTCLAGFYNTTVQVYSRTLTDFEFPTGIEGTSARDNIQIYPVPATSELNIRNLANIRSIEILDVTGKVISTINTSSDEMIRIPVNNLKRGMYIIRFNTTDGKVIKRFVKG